jgi:HD-like signal output (HDOD) protein
MLNPSDFKRALLTIDALGSTPAILAKLGNLAKDPNTDLETLCALMRNDGPLAADIIRISNSPYYAPATFHSNLVSAVNQIGLREVVRVVNLSLSRQLLARDLSSYGVTAYEYWSASVAAGLVIEAVAEKTGLHSEDAYTIGILHAIGRVLINQVIEQHGFAIFWDGQQPIEKWERDSVGFDYAEAGAMLLEHWHFPATTCEIIRGQLDAANAVEPASLIGALQFTRRLLALTGSDFETKAWLVPEGDPFVRAAGLTPASLAQLVSDCREDFQKILQSVDLK